MAASAVLVMVSAGVSTTTVTRQAAAVLPGGQVLPVSEEDTELMITLSPVSGFLTATV